MRHIAKHYLSEHFINLFGKDPDKIKYLDWVWDALETGYAKLGGLKGMRKEDLLDDNIFWKIKKQNNKLLAVNIYIYKMIGKTRKAICGSCVQNPAGKAALIGMIQDDINLLDRQSWTEVSGAVQHWHEKYNARPIPYEIAKRILAANGKNDVEPAFDEDGNQDPYSYKRHIDGELLQKKMFGNIADIDALCNEYEYINKVTGLTLPALLPKDAKPSDTIDNVALVAETKKTNAVISFNALKKFILESI